MPVLARTGLFTRGTTQVLRSDLSEAIDQTAALVSEQGSTTLRTTRRSGVYDRLTRFRPPAHGGGSGRAYWRLDRRE